MRRTTRQPSPLIQIMKVLAQGIGIKPVNGALLTEEQFGAWVSAEPGDPNVSRQLFA